MGERRARIRYGRALSGTAALALLCALGASARTPGDDPDRAAFQQALARQAAALRSGDESGFLATVEPDRRGEQRLVFRNLRRLPLDTWSYEVLEVTDRTDRTATVRATLRYRLAGYDRTATTADERLRFVRRDGTWRISSEAANSDTQLWEQGAMTVVRGEHSLVLGVGRNRSELRALAAAADRAVPAVARIWPAGWTRRTVLEAPASTRQMARLLGSPAANSRTYAGIAAVTTGEAGSRASGPGDRIVVNPKAYGLLSEEGRQVVLTHETTHVATRRQTTSTTPLWLSEGIADWAGYRRSRLTAREAAPELARTTPIPRALPSDGDFRFGNDPARLARAYEGGWLACRMIGEQWGSGKLLALYEHAGREDVDAALRSALGLSRTEFTARWRSYVRGQLHP
ncbi:DUF4157 domain-containing protein [Streptomyces oryzae]|uniref:DUF4157 domain-containing protein n=1 Tax=Streptomyces oryzae TaxID=1434886 RepID=A0ABS3X7D4_9ACTN|nr:DUF4157 domain-containing protein [Streptomyces oryzae]MBO8191295.1 DUF4157 domain-containing protein [Streptomyces oryzae]